MHAKGARRASSRDVPAERRWDWCCLWEPGPHGSLRGAGGLRVPELASKGRAQRQHKHYRCRLRRAKDRSLSKSGFAEWNGISGQRESMAGTFAHEKTARSWERASEGLGGQGFRGRGRIEPFGAVEYTWDCGSALIASWPFREICCKIFHFAMAPRLFVMALSSRWLRAVSPRVISVGEQDRRRRL